MDPALFVRRIEPQAESPQVASKPRCPDWAQESGNSVDLLKNSGRIPNGLGNSCSGLNSCGPLRRGGFTVRVSIHNVGCIRSRRVLWRGHATLSWVTRCPSNLCAEISSRGVWDRIYGINWMKVWESCSSCRTALVGGSFKHASRP